MPEENQTPATNPSPEISASSFEWPKLEQDVQVGNAIFRKGVSSRLVIEAAQRFRSYQAIPVVEAERIRQGNERFHALMAEIRERNDNLPLDTSEEESFSKDYKFSLGHE